MKVNNHLERETIMSHRILIVDDEETVLQSLDILLTSEGHDIIKAINSEKAVDLIKDGGFDLLITDIRMTPVDGMDLMKLARKVQPDMPSIVISAFSSDKTIQQSYDLGCIAYLRKPFRIQEVLVAVNKALGESQ